MHSSKNNQQEKIKMYDKKLKYKIFKCFCSSSYDIFCHYTGMGRRRRTWKQMLPGRLLLTHQKKMLHLKLQV